MNTSPNCRASISPIADGWIQAFLVAAAAFLVRRSLFIDLITTEARVDVLFTNRQKYLKINGRLGELISVGVLLKVRI